MSNAGAKLMMAAAGQGGASLVEVANSALIDGDNSKYLYRDIPSPTGTNKTGTFSGWFYVGNQATASQPQTLVGSHKVGAGQTIIMMQYNTGKMRILMETIGNAVKVDWETTRVFRDNAWYHFVWTVDTTPATPIRKLWINGVEETAFTKTTDTMAQNDEFALGADMDIVAVGNRASLSVQRFDGYLAEFVYLHGQVVTDATDFGEFDTTGNYWTPKSSDDIKTLTFGTNGFYLSNEDGVAELDYSKTSSTAATVSYQATSVDSNNATDYAGSHDGIAIGTADASRQVVVDITGERSSAGARTVSTCTIGGVSASLLVRQTSDNGDCHEIWAADVTTGTTADIDIAFSAGMTSCGIAVWAVYDAADTYITASNEGTPTSESVNIPTNAVAIAGGRNIGLSGASWTGVTERYDENVGPSNMDHSGGDTATSGTPTTITYTPSSGHADDTMCVVVFLPADGPVNHFTNNNTVVTSTHTPTNSHNLWNPLNNRDSALSNGNLTWSDATGSGDSIYSTLPMTTGKWYFEVELDAFTTGLWLGVGCNDTRGPTGNVEHRSMNANEDIAADHGTWVIKPSTGYTIDGDGQGDPGTDQSLNTFSASDRLGIAVDMSLGDGSNKLYFRKNGTWENSGDPVAGTGYIFNNLPALLFAVAGNRSSGTDTVTLVTDEADFGATAPTDYLALNTTNIAAATTRSSTDLAEHFQQEFIAHNGTSTVFTLGWDADTYPTLFKIKNIDSTEKWFWVDGVNGYGKYLPLDQTGTSQQTDANVLTVSGTSITLGSTLANAAYIVICERIGDVTGLHIEVVADADMAASTVVAHGNPYGKPAFLAAKHRDTTQSWYVQHKGLGNDAHYLIHDAYSQVNTGGTVFTALDATNFTTGTWSGWNTASDFVVYSWAETEFNSIGSALGNGSTDGPLWSMVNSVGVQIQPVYFISKSANTINNWDQRDIRDTDNPAENYISPSNSPAGLVSSDKPLMGNMGIKITSSGTNLNGNGSKLCFMAIGYPVIDSDGRLLTAR